MEDTKRLRRRYRLLMMMSVIFLLISIVMVFLTAGLARWLLLTSWALNTFLFWELRKSLPPAP